MSTFNLRANDLSQRLRAAEREAAEAYAAVDGILKEMAGFDGNPLADAKLNARLEAAQREHAAAAARADQLRQQLARGLPAGAVAGADFLGPGRGLPGGGSGSGAARELAEHFAQNPEAANAPSGAKVVSSLIETALARPVHDGYRAALDGGNLGAFTLNATTWADLPRRRLSVLDLIPVAGAVEGLGGEKVQYFKTTVRTNNAATVAALAEKPESVLTITREETTMWTYAHISEQVPLQFLMTPSGLQQFLEQDMAASVLEAHEADILAGTGTTEVDGILSVAGTLTQPSTGDPLGDIRRGLTQLNNVNIVPDALVLNPADAERLDLETDAEGQYHTGGPLSESSPRLWRTPIVVTTGLPAGTAILGNFALGAIRWTGLSRLEWGRINTDLRYNAVRLVAEVAASAAVTRPGAFVKVSF
ncbi:MAG TPA: phage major capsid protein [Tepidiformaceae bacterium]|nr:phage major capsid protein [Tepidiformaceae bacterium]